MKRMTRFAVTFAVTAGGLLAARAASAQDAGTNPTCASLPNPVYLDGSSAFVPTVQAFAVKLAAESTPTTIVYLSPGSCAGRERHRLATPISPEPANYFTLTGTTVNKLTCTLPASGQKADIGVSDVFYGSCSAVAPATRGHAEGLSGPGAGDGVRGPQVQHRHRISDCGRGQYHLRLRRPGDIASFT